MTVVKRDGSHPIKAEVDHSSTLNVDLRWQAYNQLSVPSLRVHDALLVGMGGIEEGDRVLDVGCAGGKLLAQLRREHPHISLAGVDTDEGHFIVTQADLASEGLTPIDFRTERVEQLSFADDSFDKIIAAYVLYYLEDPTVGLRELQRVARPGGLIAIATIDPANKPYHRELERYMADLIGATPPKVPAATFDSDTAGAMLPEFFEVVEDNPAISAMVVSKPEDVDVYMNSLWTMRTAREEPYPAWSEWEWALQKARERVEAIIAEQGELRDLIRHHWYICRNVKTA